MVGIIINIIDVGCVVLVNVDYIGIVVCKIVQVGIVIVFFIFDVGLQVLFNEYKCFVIIFGEIIVVDIVYVIICDDSVD